MKFFSFLLSVFGVFCLLFSVFLYWQRVNPNRLAFASESQIKDSSYVSASPPTEVLILDVNIDLAIFPAQIHKGVWETTTKGASYLVTSPIPGQMGNSIIYAHNFTNLFGSLPKVKVGEKVLINYANFSEKTFTIKYIFQVTPQDTSILSPSTDSRLTLYTCSGFLDSKRFVVVATRDN
jgi:LPXTG-site transpeptidase (sortase) family protein